MKFPIPHKLIGETDQLFHRVNRYEKGRPKISVALAGEKDAPRWGRFQDVKMFQVILAYQSYGSYGTGYRLPDGPGSGPMVGGTT